MTPPADPKPPSPPPAPPILVAAPESIPPPSSPVILVPEKPASPVISPAPVVIKEVESVPAQAAPTSTPAPASPIPVIVEKVKETQPPTSPPASTATVVESSAQSTNASAAPIVPVITKAPTAIAAIGRSDTATYEPQKKSDKVPVLIATRSAPELQQDSHELHARPSTLSFVSAPPETFVRRDTHVVVIDPAVNEQQKRHWRDRIRKFWVSKLGGRFFLRLLLGQQGSNVATAVVSRY